MSLIIFFDNNRFKLNNVIFNSIKRFLLYEVVSSYLVNTVGYKNILLFKTNPSLIEIKLNVTNTDNDIETVITNLNNVIYKHYDTYGTNGFKNIIDKIYEIEKNNYLNTSPNPNPNRIIVITSIDNEFNFTESNLKYINGLLNIIKSDIKLINISNYKFIKNLFPKITEYFVNIKNFKSENIFEKNNNPFVFDNLFEYTFDKFTKLVDDLNIKLGIELVNSDGLIDINPNYQTIDISNNTMLKNLIFLFGLIEFGIDEFKTKPNELDKIIKILGFCFKSNNTHLNNILKSTKNSIYDIVQRNSDFVIKLPINSLDTYLSDTYIKYILEFYEIVYPKIYKFNNTLDSIKKLNKKNPIQNHTKFSIIKTNQIDLIEIDDISTQYLTSTLSLTNWVEEYKNYNPFGFLIKFKPNKLSYKGILDFGSSIFKTYPNMIVEQVTTNWVSMYDYYQIILTEFNSNIDKDNHEENDNIPNPDIFNIGNFNILDNIHGDGNIFLPVYINKNHWELTKGIWSYHISFIFNCFEFEYNKKMDNIYFYTLLKLFGDLKQIGLSYKNGQNLKSTIRLFCYVLRTCIQVLIDNKYLHSIKKDYPKFHELVLKTETFEINSNFSDWIVRLIQLMISNECEQTQLDIDLKKITNHIFSNYIIQNYKMDFWENINRENISVNAKNVELENLKHSVLQDNITWLYLEFDLRLLNKITKSIYQLKGFNQFIKTLDLTNGCVQDDFVSDKSEKSAHSKNINFKNIENIIEQVCLEQFDLTYYNVDISKYIYVK